METPANKPADVVPIGQGSDGRQGRGPVMTGRNALHIRAMLAKDGKAICEGCKKIGPIRDYIVTLYKGSVLTALCNECRQKFAVLISPTETGTRVKLVDPDRDSGKLIEVAPASALSDLAIKNSGPVVEKTEF